jgi:hypothetical protein
MLKPVPLHSTASIEVAVDPVEDVSGALALAAQWGARLGTPGSGSTRDLWEHLATIAADDLGAARAIEPHLDAVAILKQAGAHPPTGAWGVFAAEGGPPLRALRDGEGWVLEGTKPWCSLADRLNAALVTALRDDGERQLFAVQLRQRSVHAHDGEWVARGLSEIPSGSVDFKRTKATPVGDAGWYLTRPGFAWGGIGVAACWYGGAVGIARDLFAAQRVRSDDISQFHLGAVDVALEAARVALADAAARIDGGWAVGSAGKILAKRVRAIVVGACETTLLHSAHALGPAPLARDAAHAKRVADLELYIRQHHAEHDLASLGRSLLDGGDAPW